MKELEAIWKRYLSGRAVADRNLLIEHYMPQVRCTAARLWAKLPEGIELDDLVSAGTFGLIDALAGFEPERGLKFETYSLYRIRGAILDEMRKMDWVPRLVRAQAARLKSAGEELSRRLGRVPTVKELAKQLGLKVAEVERIQRQIEPVDFISLSKKWYETDSFKDVTTAHWLVDEKAKGPERRLAHLDVMRLITKSLDRDSRLIIILYYYEGHTMKAIGETLGLSESRVSQLHSQIIERFQARFANRREEIAA